MMLRRHPTLFALAAEEPPAPAADPVPESVVTLLAGDCRELLPELPDNSVHLVATDPPYFIDGLDDGWSKGGNGVRASGSAGAGLPAGMKFDAEQGRRLQAFLEPVAAQLCRVLAPGGFAVVFSQPRLYHRMAVALEDAGFELRDALAWQHTLASKSKAFGMEHLVSLHTGDAGERARILASMGGRKTPQLRPDFELMALAQKPREGTITANWERWGTGLADLGQSLDLRGPGTLMAADKAQRDGDEDHRTRKPVRLMEHLVRLFSRPGQTVLDPFSGSGSTAVAAAACGRSCIAMDIRPEYIDMARRRLRAAGLQT